MVEIRDISEGALPLYRHIIRKTANSMQILFVSFYLLSSACLINSAECPLL